MFKVFFSDAPVRDLIMAFDNEIEAVNFAIALGALYLDEDKDHPGCYDGIDKRGRVICIEKI